MVWVLNIGYQCLRMYDVIVLKALYSIEVGCSFIVGSSYIKEILLLNAWMRLNGRQWFQQQSTL